MGAAFRAALEAGLRVEALVVSDEPYIDVGTPAGLAAGWRGALTGVPQA